MTKATFHQLTTTFLYFGAAFMVGESIFHFSGIRLSDADWLPGALSFTYFFQCLWASASLLIAILLWLVARHRQLWAVLLPPLAGFAVFHAGVLGWWSFLPVIETWEYSSLFVWNPWYPLQLKLEALVLLLFAVWIAWGWRRGWLK